MKVHKCLHIHTVHNLQQGSTEQWQETKGSNEKGALAIELFTMHTTEVRHADRVIVTGCSALSIEEASMHCMDSCSHTLSTT